MVLDAAMSESCEEVTTVMLRDKKIKIFDDNFEETEGGRFKLEELCNVECIFASHNLIKDVIGIGQLTTLVELNLSFNMIEDISPLESLTLLRALFLNHNKLQVIDSLSKLKALKQLGLFHNEIIESQSVMKTLVSLPKLREVSIDGNPCAREAAFGYELILKMPKLRMLNEEAIKELDRDVGEQYFLMNELEVPKPPIESHKIPVSVKSKEDKENSGKAKSVRFATPANIDDEEEWEHEKDVKELRGVIEQLQSENYRLKQKLDKSH